jgi:hypothetical protein
VEGIHAEKRWPGLYSLKGITETPLLRPDGTVLDVPGYDPTTGYLYAPSADSPRVAKEPSLEDAPRLRARHPVTRILDAAGARRRPEIGGAGDRDEGEMDADRRPTGATCAKCGASSIA